MFQPYSGVKTSILILDKDLANRTKRIAFFKVENDGFDLGAQRRPIDKNDLPEVAEGVREYLSAARAVGSLDGEFEPNAGAPVESRHRHEYLLRQVAEEATEYRAGGTMERLTERGAALVGSKEEVAANGDYNLSGERYRRPGVSTHRFPLVRIADVCVINPRKSALADLDPDTSVSFVPMADVAEHRIAFKPKKEKILSEVAPSYTYFAENDVLLAKVTPCFENGKAGIARGLVNGIAFGSSEFFVMRCG